MDSAIRMIWMIVFALVAGCGINSLLMEMHLMPKVAAIRTGILEEVPGVKTQRAEKIDAGYGDFWYVDHVPC